MLGDVCIQHSTVCVMSLTLRDVLIFIYYWLTELSTSSHLLTPVSALTGLGQASGRMGSNTF